jgi:hypothetical protein
MFAKLEGYLISAGIALILMVGVFAWGWHIGTDHVQAKWDADKKAQAVAISTVQAKQAEVTTQFVTKYVDRVQTIQGATKTIIQKVPVYVTAKADAACPIPNGFVRLHDAAAEDSMQFPANASSVDGQSSEVKLSDVASTIAGNYGICHANAEKLTALQDWVKGQAEAAKPSK